MTDARTEGSRSEGNNSGVRRIGRFLRQRVVELSLAVFVLAFAAFLPFIDTGNLTRFLLAASYLSVGRNPYAIFPYPPPPGLFAVVLPAFAVYNLSGHSLFAANFSLKLFGLVGLLASGELLRRIALLCGSRPTVARRLTVVVLTSPVLFFISFIWVEQDIVGIALTLAGIYVVLREERGNDRPWVELAGFGLLAFAAFFYYFPIFVFPTLLLYSGNRVTLVRRLTWTAGTLAAFGLGFLYLPGWNFLTNSTGTPGFVSASPYSILTLLQPALFLPASPAQVGLAQAFVVVLVVAEVAVPVVLWWRGTSWVTSVALAMVLPFLFLDILNGDEFVWPLPFLLLALVLAYPSSAKGIRLWLVEAYLIPMVFVMNLFDSPGPGPGTGIFYLSYPQFHNALVLWSMVPDFVSLTQLSDVLLWGGLAALALFVLRTSRPQGDPSSIDSSTETLTPRNSAPRVSGEGLGGVARPRWALPKGRRVSLLVGTAAVLIVLTVATASLPSPSLTSNGDQEFPVGFFASYPVANSTVTYALSAGGREIVIAPNYGNPASLDNPWRTVNFSRDVTSESLHLTLDLGVQSEPGFAFNTTVLSLGSSGLNLVTPFVPPSPSALLTPVGSQNVSSVNVTSPQFVGTPVRGSSFNGSSYAEYDVGPWVASGGNLTIYFRWAGVQLTQNLVAEIFIGNASYELFGLNGLYFAGVKPSSHSNWTFAPPQAVNAESWHSFTVTAESDRLALSLDGIGLPLPSLGFEPDAGGALTLGDAGPAVNLFQEFDFVGAMVGPFYTTGSPAMLSNMTLCGFSTEPTYDAACTPFASPWVQADYSGASTLTVKVPAGSIVLSSAAPWFQVGRLSPVGPGLTLLLTSLTISSTHSLIHLTWVIDGAIAAPAILVLGVIRYPRMARASPQ